MVAVLGDLIVETYLFTDGFEQASGLKARYNPSGVFTV